MRGPLTYIWGAKGSLQQAPASVVSCHTASNGGESPSTSVSSSIRCCWRLRRCWPATDQPEELSWGVHLRGILCFLSGECVLFLYVHSYVTIQHMFLLSILGQWSCLSFQLAPCGTLSYFEHWEDQWVVFHIIDKLVVWSKSTPQMVVYIDENISKCLMDSRYLNFFYHK